MLDARPDEDDPVFDDRSRRASQRLNNDLGCRPSRHRRASLGSLIDGRRQGKPGHAPQLTSDNDAQGEIRSRIRAPVPAPVDGVQETGVCNNADAAVQKIAVTLCIEWDDPDPGRAAPTASITLTQEAVSGATTQLDSEMDRDHDNQPDRVERSEHKTVLESLGETVELNPQLVEESQPSSPQSALHPQSDSDIGEAPSNPGRESDGSSLRNHKHQLSEGDRVDSPVGISCEATQDPDANHPPRLGEACAEQGLRNPTDETDADVHRDGDDQAPGRPEVDFVWF